MTPRPYLHKDHHGDEVLRTEQYQHEELYARADRKSARARGNIVSPIVGCLRHSTFVLSKWGGVLSSYVENVQSEGGLFEFSMSDVGG